jgi:hypothetical protein
MGTIKDANHGWRFFRSDPGDIAGGRLFELTMRDALTRGCGAAAAALREAGVTVCDHDGGFIAGRVCRFEVKPLAADLDAG